MMHTIRSYYLPRLYIGLDSISEIASILEEFNAELPLIICDPGIEKAGILDMIVKTLEERELQFGVFANVTPEVPLSNVEDCISQARSQGYRSFIGVGGGSSIDIAKISAVMMTNEGSVKEYIGVGKVKNPGLICLAVPTTAGTGAEVTPNAIVKDEADGVKKGIVSPHIFPTAVILDPTLTLSLPPKITAATGIDALTHAVESYTSKNATPFSDLFAAESIRLISQNLRRAYFWGEDIEARFNMLLGSTLAGVSLTHAGTGAVHAMAYPLGGRFDIPHGLANAVLLPYVMKYNLVANLDKFANVLGLMNEDYGPCSVRVAAEMGVEEIQQLCVDVGIPENLRSLGIPEEAIPQMAEEASRISRLLINNPRDLKKDEIEEIYRNAY